jgi:integrase
MASISRYKGAWRAQVYVGGVRASKVCRTRSEALAWAEGRKQELARGGADTTFGEVAEQHLALHLPKLSNAKSQATYEQSIRDHVLPVLGARKIREIKRTDLVALVRSVGETGKVETAHRLGQRINAIFNHAIDSGLIESHPAAGLARVLPTKIKRTMPAVSAAEVPDLLRAIESYNEPVTRIGLLLLAHTFVRTSELLGARWSEIRGEVLVVPADRMKRRLPHVVPISTATQQLLRDLDAYTGESAFLLASPRNPDVPISENTLLFALYRLGYRGRMTGHGFRAVASSILNESGLWSRDAIERQLAHKETDAVRDAYMRAEFLEERTRMMEWYSNHLGAIASISTE